jgi:pilus assembly protein Flp/PilA
MRNTFLKLYVKAQVMLATLKQNEEGQDLIEYALVVALIAFAAIVGMNTVAQGINSAFNNIATTLNTNIT